MRLDEARSVTEDDALERIVGTGDGDRVAPWWEVERVDDTYYAHCSVCVDHEITAWPGEDIPGWAVGEIVEHREAHRAQWWYTGARWRCATVDEARSVTGDDALERIAGAAPGPGRSPWWTIERTGGASYINCAVCGRRGLAHWRGGGVPPHATEAVLAHAAEHRATDWYAEAVAAIAEEGGVGRGGRPPRRPPAPACATHAARSPGQPCVAGAGGPGAPAAPPGPPQTGHSGEEER
jgi:hypothetical protein